MRTWYWRETGTNRQLGGHPSGTEELSRACSTFCLIPQVIAPTMQDTGRIPEVSIGELSGSNWIERESGLAGFFDPGWYDRVKLKWLKNRA